jgi:HAD superfamily hydrolase (TIGR01509 family)
MTNTNIRSMAIDTLTLHPEWFTHPCEQRIITNLIRMIFTPELFVATRKIYPEAIKFIKACKQQGHDVFIISNWDTESFRLLQQLYADLFDQTDGIVLSGNENELKPSTTIYQILLDRYHLDPHDCWFIDDQKENVIAAQKLGIHGIVCPYKRSFKNPFIKQPHFHAIAQQMKAYYTTPNQ